MKKLPSYAFVVLYLAALSVTQACGFCIEDKVAAVYDHALVTRAVERGHEVVFLEVADAERINSAQWRFLVRTVENAVGVERRSVRTSVAPQVLSFELNASRSASAAVLKQINEGLRKQRMRVDLVKILNQRRGVALR